MCIRDSFRVDGVPIGELIPYDEVPGFAEARKRTIDGSIIIIVATDAPLLPHQCDRLAQRATVGLARVGGIGANSSGDIFFCFATGNRGLPGAEERTRQVSDCRMISPDAMTPLFEACAEATEEAILNAMCMATTTTGIDGRTVHALPLSRLRELCCS